MMNGRPNDPEYCQNIYEAAKHVIEQYEITKEVYTLTDEDLIIYIQNLERALEGKENV